MPKKKANMWSFFLLILQSSGCVSIALVLFSQYSLSLLFFPVQFLALDEVFYIAETKQHTHHHHHYKLTYNYKGNTEIFGRIATKFYNNANAEHFRLKWLVWKVYCTCNLFNWVPNVDLKFKITHFQAIIGLIGVFEGASFDKLLSLSLFLFHPLFYSNIHLFSKSVRFSSAQMFTVHAINVIFPSHQSRKLSFFGI